MSGFVDVSGMSYQAVKRMGQMDDVDYQPRRARTYASSTPARKFSVSDVWAAACAAQRVNGEYVKEGRNTYDDQGRVLSTKRRNRDIMAEFLDNPDRLLVEDIETGEKVRNFLQNDLTFRAIKGKLTEFDTAVSKVLAVKDHFDTFKNRYELAVVAALPSSADRAQVQQNTNDRMKFATGGLIGNPGDKIATNVEVVSSTYSQQYNIFWVKAITDKDQPVMFSNKENFDAGTWLTIQGKVKAHRDNLTQLNYVKVL